jgi:hypothetical protein
MHIYVKLGKALKVNDLVLRKFDSNGKASNTDFSWKVAELIFASHKLAADLVLGEEYSVYVAKFQEVFPFRLVGIFHVLMLLFPFLCGIQFL